MVFANFYAIFGDLVIRVHVMLLDVFVALVVSLVATGVVSAVPAQEFVIVARLPHDE